MENSENFTPMGKIQFWGLFLGLIMLLVFTYQIARPSEDISVQIVQGALFLILFGVVVYDAFKTIANSIRKKEFTNRNLNKNEVLVFTFAMILLQALVVILNTLLFSIVAGFFIALLAIGVLAIISQATNIR